MKKLYYLVLIFSALYMTSCADVTEKCTKNSNCDDGYTCYAGWCSDKIAQGHQYFDIQLKDSEKKDILSCEDTLVSKVKISVYRDDILLPETDENKDPVTDLAYSYQFTLPCEEVVTKALDSGKKQYFYIGTHSENHPNGKGPLQLNKDYRVVFEFLKGDDSLLDTKEININADAFSDPDKNKDARDSVNAMVHRAKKATLNVSWYLTKGVTEYREGSDEICFKGDQEHENNIYKFYIRLAKKYENLDALCDESSNNCNFDNSNIKEVFCGTNWNLDFTINEATSYALEIYAADVNKRVMYKRNISIDITEELLNSDIVYPIKELNKVNTAK